MKRFLLLTTIILFFIANSASASLLNLSVKHTFGQFTPQSDVTFDMSIKNYHSQNMNYSVIIPETPDKKMMEKILIDRSMLVGLIKAGETITMPIKITLPNSGYYTLRFIVELKNADGGAYEECETIQFRVGLPKESVNGISPDDSGTRTRDVRNDGSGGLVLVENYLEAVYLTDDDVRKIQNKTIVKSRYLYLKKVVPPDVLEIIENGGYKPESEKEGGIHKFGVKVIDLD